MKNCQVESGGLRIHFNFPLDAGSATDAASYVAQQWNYKWTENYGSDHYHPETEELGEQSVTISSVELSEDRTSVLLRIPGLRPVDQLRLQLEVIDESGSTFSEQIYWTIHHVVPPKF